MNEISVVVVTENAEDVIRNCLESAKWADEIIVADAASSDRTVEIARRYTNKIINLDPQLNSGERWNRGIQAASKNWIFVLESDKRIPPLLKAELEAMIKDQSFAQADGYQIETRNYFLDHWIKMASFHPDEKLYIFRKETASFEPRHRGCIVFQGKSKKLNSYIEHRVYRSLYQCLAKVDQESTRLAEEFSSARARFKKSYLITRPWRSFKKQYFRHGGAKEGMPGLLLSLIATFESFLIYAKQWEISNTET